MTRKDCVYYHCEHQMGASIDCCTLRNGLGDCPCTLNCEKYANKNYVYKLGLNELQRMNNGEEMGNDVIYRQDAIDALGAEPEVWINDDDYAMGANNQWHYDVNALKAVPSAIRPEYEAPKTYKEQLELDCDFCRCHESGDTLYESADWDNGIGFDYIRNIKYCPICGRGLLNEG